MFHLVDDDLILLEVLSEVLQSKGYETITFSSPDDYIEYLESPSYVNPVAILTDFLMPSMNGVDLSKKVKLKYPKQRIIIISGTSELIHDGGELFCTVIQKPYRIKDLSVILKTIYICYKEKPKKISIGCPYGLNNICTNCVK